MKKIAHISDIHIGSPYFVDEWGRYVIKKVNEEKPEILVVTGDITDDGVLEMYEEAKKYLDEINVDKKILVPGNHDSRHAGYVIFEKFFGSRYPFYEDSKVAIFGIDSSQPDLNTGHIGREHYEEIKEKLSNPEKFNILALHHHLIPVPRTGRERQIPLDAGDVLELCTSSNIEMVLSGHRHLRWWWNLDGTYFITGGTATTKKLNGISYPSFNIIEIYKDKVSIREINVRDKKSREILGFERK